VTDTVSIRPLGDEAEATALGAIEGWAFGFPPPESLSWFKNAGPENVRVALRGTRVVGGLLLVPMGQWFGGTSVPLVGIAGVAVAPEERGRGVALALMQNALREVHARNGITSGLYPATRSLYRAVGYELSGTRYAITIKPGDVGVVDRALELRPLAEADHPAIERAYADVAREHDGYLDRGPYIWRRVRSPRGEPALGWVVEEQGQLVGYAFVRQKTTSIGHYDLTLTDVQAKTAGAARRLLTFLGDHRTLASSVVWHGGPSDPLAMQLPEGAFEMKLGLHWMTRIVNALGALSVRGYSPAARGSVDFLLEDPLLSDNTGPIRLEVEAGHGQATRGGSGALRISPRGLAALFTGFSSAFALARMGLCEGPEEVLARATGLFAGSAPAMPDMY
jgi:predicted acetyltransferase